MDKTIKINLAGILFRLEEDAYKMLRDYLQAIDIRLKNTPGGNEILEDIESRISEIFRSQNNPAVEITRENVEAMIAIIGKPEDFDSAGTTTENLSFTERRKRLSRNTGDSIAGGVCSGIGAYLNLDPVWIRILFVIFTFFFGAGILIYLALWIVLPLSKSFEQKYRNSSPAGNAINEIFRALGKIFFIALRIILIIFGTALTLAGLLAIITFVMVFFLRYPASVTTDNFGFNVFYLKDFINLIVNPSITPWILTLSFLMVVLPALALIYWGVKSIFWFRARDGIFSLSGFLLWVVSAAVLAMILLNQGVSFAQTGKSVQNLAVPAPDTLYVMPGRKLSDLHSENRICLPGEEFCIYFEDTDKDLNITADLDMEKSTDGNVILEIKRRSTGKSRSAAIDKANSLEFGFSLNGDTLKLDEYFTIAAGKKWSFDNIEVDLSVPDGTVIHFDVPSGALWHQYTGYERDEDYDPDLNGKNGSYWKMTDGDLTKIEVKSRMQRH